LLINYACFARVLEEERSSSVPKIEEFYSSIINRVNYSGDEEVKSYGDSQRRVRNIICNGRQYQFNLFIVLLGH